MFSNRVVLFVFHIVIFVLVSFVNNGHGQTDSSSDHWKPVSYASRINSRRSFGRKVDYSSSSWFPSVGNVEYRVMQRVLDDCIKSSDGLSCLKSKTVTFLDRVARLKSIPLFGGVSLARQQNEIPEAPAQSPDELEANLPRDLSQKSDKLDQMIYDRLTNFLRSHTLVMDFTESSDGEARGNKLKGGKKGGHLLLAMAAMAATLGPIAFKGLAALAFKALLVAKIALVLSGVLALKKLFHSDGHRSLNDDVSFKPLPQGRSFTEGTTEHAHKLAYSAQLQRPIIVT